MSELVSLDHQGDIAVIRISRPPVNAISTALANELERTARKVSGDESVKAVVLTGTDRAFAAGAEISEFEEEGGARRLPDAVLAAGDALAAIPRPVIAAVSGYALGAGLELAMACDFRVAAEKARFGQPEILLGLIPGAGGTQRLARLVGLARAKEIVWSGRHVNAEEALRIGLVDRVAPAGGHLDAALAWAAELARGAVAAMGLAKSAMHRGLETTLADGLRIEAQAFDDAFATEDARTGIRSFFEHGPGQAAFSGR